MVATLCIYIYIHEYICVYIHIHMYTYMHVYIYIYRFILAYLLIFTGASGSSARARGVCGRDVNVLGLVGVTIVNSSNGIYTSCINIYVSKRCQCCGPCWCPQCQRHQRYILHICIYINIKMYTYIHYKYICMHRMSMSWASLVPSMQAAPTVYITYMYIYKLYQYTFMEGMCLCVCVFVRYWLWVH